jgi:hypothetical protein
MKRLVAMLLMIAFAWGGVVTASHSSVCDESKAPSVSIEKSATNHPVKAPNDNDTNHCSTVCHGSVALPMAALVPSASIMIATQVEISTVGSTGRILAIPTPPPSLS